MKKSKYIDHTALKPNTTLQQIEQLCKQAIVYDFASVCINPCWIEVAKKLLAGSDVKVCTVIGFPLGAMSTKAKVYEAQDAIAMGADEIDMVINIGKLIDHDLTYVTQEIAQIKQAIGNHVLKVIIETCLLTDEQIVDACHCVMQAKADFVKTSTGFSTAGATVEHVALMKKTVGDQVLIKAAGGVSNRQDFEAMIQAGASRIGTSKGTALMENQEDLSNSY